MAAVGASWQHKAMLVLVTALSGGMTIGMCSYAFGSYVQPLTDDFGWSRVEINVAMTVNFVMCGMCHSPRCLAHWQ